MEKRISKDVQTKEIKVNLIISLRREIQRGERREGKKGGEGMRRKYNINIS